MSTTVPMSGSDSVPSDKNLSTSEIQGYRSSAATLAVRVMETNAVLAKEVIIPQDLLESIYRHLVSIHNAQHIRAHHTNILKQPIYAQPDYFLKAVLVSVDSTAHWAKKVAVDDTSLGDPAFDEIMQRYKLYVKSIDRNDSRKSIDLELLSENPLNIKALCKLFARLNGVRYASPNGMIGQSSGIFREAKKNYTLYQFFIGWGDCPAGCMYGHWWTYAVYPNATVLFVDQNGDPVPEGFRR
jgi:hypothetical protein